MQSERDGARAQAFHHEAEDHPIALSAERVEFAARSDLVDQYPDRDEPLHRS